MGKYALIIILLTECCATETLGVILLQLVGVGDEEERGGGQQLEQGGEDADDEVARVQERQHLQRSRILVSVTLKRIKAYFKIIQVVKD